MTNTFIVKQDFAIDVSYYEPIWYERAVYSEINPKPKHVIARATYGVRKDTEFINHWNYWREHGVPVAAYHYWYGTPMYSGQTATEGMGDQADNFIAQIMAAGYSGKERLWLDLEEYGNTTVANGNTYRALVKQWLDHVERETGQKPGIYSRKDQLERMMVSNLMPTWINDHDMWWAWYPDGPYIDKNEWFPISSRYRPSWYHREPVMWQYSDGGWIDGFIMKDNHQPTTFDFNVMLDGYLESLGGATPPTNPPPPPIGETKMKKGTQKLNTAPTNIKPMDGRPTIAGLQPGWYVYGNLSTTGTDIVDVTAYYKGNEMAKVTLSTPCKLSIGNLTVTDVSAPPPPPPVGEPKPPKKVTVINDDGSTYEATTFTKVG